MAQTIYMQSAGQNVYKYGMLLPLCQGIARGCQAKEKTHHTIPGNLSDKRPRGVILVHKAVA